MTLLESSLAYPLWVLLTVLMFHAIPRQQRNRFNIFAGLCFLLYVAPISAVCLAIVTVLTYLAASQKNDAQTRRLILMLGVLIAGFLTYKYQQAYSVFGLPTIAVLVGFSFYILRAIHYLVEMNKGTLKAHSFEDFASYMFFLPTLLIGPIHRFPAYLENNRTTKVSPAQLQEGLERIIFGYAKIVLLANLLVSDLLANAVLRLEDTHYGLSVYLDCVVYGLNLYLQFSGYSDIAIGFAMLLGFRVMENFNWPFISKNISDFWRRWHISLTSWCRDYVYMGTAAVTRNHALAVITSMLVLGIWHELTVKYIFWGLLHGSAIVVCNRFQKWKTPLPSNAPQILHRSAQAFSAFMTFNFVILSFAITKEESLAGAWNIYLTIATGLL